jgi:hypothetical protein
MRRRYQEEYEERQKEQERRKWDKERRSRERTKKEIEREFRHEICAEKFRIMDWTWNS